MTSRYKLSKPQREAFAGFVNTGLKSHKIYYVHIRTYKKIGNATYYSTWSKAKKVKTGK